MGAERIRGFYTHEMLRGGMKDQYAVIRSYGTVTIELRHELNRFVVYEIIASADGTRSTATSHNKLGDAHRTFTRLTRKHP